MKKLIALLLAMTMVFALAACGESGSNTTTAPSGTTTPETTTPETTTPETTTPETTVPEETDPQVTVMTHAEYIAAAIDDAVVVECYVQAHQSWWDNKITVYAQDEDGAYFLYNMACSEEDAALLVPGTKIRVTGFKGEWAGELEIVDATFEIIEGSYIAEPMDVTNILGTDELINYQNMFVSFSGMTVEPSVDAEGNEVAFLYKWNGSGSAGDDLYFNVSINGQTYNFCVESYLTGDGTDVYEAVEAMQIGDVIDLEGFLYWYDGVNPHITSVTAAN